MKIRNVLILILITLSLQNPVFAQEGLSTLMLRELAEMEVSLLRQKSQYLGLSDSGSRGDLLDRLYAYYGFVPESDDRVRSALEETGSSVQLERAHYYYMNRDSDTLLLSGSVSLLGEDWTLAADTVFYDLAMQSLSAVGSVTFIQEEREITASGITFLVDDLDLTIMDGRILFDRTTGEGEPLLLLSEGKRLHFTPEPASYSAENTLVTSSIEHSYYRIDAEEALFIEGNDVFITDATLSMGRVPVLYLPFFFYPGKTLIFNPLFGFDSEAGSFMTLSYEIYGRNPLHTAQEQEGTFTTFFTDDRVLSRIPGSLTYEYAANPSSGLQKWALESGSFLSLYSDAYQVNGLHLGLESYTVLHDKAFSAGVAGGIAFMPPSHTSLSIPSTRFYLEPDLRVSLPSFNLSLAFPVYSDTRVLQDYVIQERFGNFFSSFFTDESALTTGSSVSSYSWEASTSFSFNPDVLGSLISEVRMNSLKTSVRFVPSYDSSTGSFIIASRTPLSYDASIRGELFNFSFSEDTAEDRRVTGYDEETRRKLSGYDLTPLKAAIQSQEEEPTTVSAKLSYSVRQTGTVETTYVKGIAGTENSRSVNTGLLTLSESVLPDLLVGTHSLESSYSDTSEDIERSQRYGLLYSHTLRIPGLSLTHTYAQELYRWEGLTASDGTVTHSTYPAQFSENSVRTHTLSFAPRIERAPLTLTPSLTFRLPPFDGKLTTAVTARIGGFALSSSLEFEDSGDQYSFIYTRNSLSYTNRFFRTSHTLTTTPDGLDILDSYQLSSLVGLETELWDLSGSVSTLWDSDISSFDSLRTEIESRYGGLGLSWDHDGTALAPSSADISLRTGELTFSFWHERISLSTDLKGSFHHSFYDISGSYLLFTLNVSVDIYRFLTFDLALTSQNRNFDRYLTLQDMLDDLLASFDFFSGGRYSTQFVMNSLTISAIHHMDDWDLVGRYEGTVAYSDNRYEWTPKVSIYLKWKAIPEINIDRELEL